MEALTLALAEEKPDFSVVFQAAHALREIGPAARSAIPSLALAMRKQEFSNYAGDAMVAIGGVDAALALIQNLDDPNVSTRTSSCDAPGRLPLEANIIVPALIRRLEMEDDSALCLSAIRALGGFGAAVPGIRRAGVRFSGSPVYTGVAQAADSSIREIEAATK